MAITAVAAALILLSSASSGRSQDSPPPVVAPSAPPVYRDAAFAGVAMPPQAQPVYEPITPGAYDVVGSYLPGPQPPNGRPMYPYRADQYWPPQEAYPESWSHLAELPKVQLGWFGDVSASIMFPMLDPRLTSGDLLDNVFPGNPVTLNSAHLDPNVLPRITVGYRYERGLGEIRASFQTYAFDGRETLGAFDPGGAATRRTSLRGNIVDLDICYFEFHAEGLAIPRNTFFMIPGRLGLGQPPVRNRLSPPLELRFTLGARGANMYFDSSAQGPTTYERVMSNFSGGGIHFATEVNQRLWCDAPFFWHGRAEGSGMWGYVDQNFARTVAGVSGQAGPTGLTIGVPTVNVEFGLSWGPDSPNRYRRFTIAYQYQEWFSFGATDDSNANLLMNGILMRGECKY